MGIKSALIITCLSLVACTTPDIESEQVRVVSPEVILGCTLRGNVMSEAPYWGVFTETTQDKLIELAKKSAFGLGGDTVVLDSPVRGDGKYTLKGTAYKCTP